MYSKKLLHTLNLSLPAETHLDDQIQTILPDKIASPKLFEIC